MTVSWPDDVDRVLGGDMTAGLAYLTPAGGAVVTAVAPVGMRDRSEGTVTFTTSLGLGKKLERIRRNPQVALAYHARDHGLPRAPRTCSCRGAAGPSRPPIPTKIEMCSVRSPSASWGRRGAASSGIAG